jgi:transcriptional regulator
MIDLIVRSSFGVLVSYGTEGLMATHLPMLIDVEDGRAVRLVSHMARANPQWRSIPDGSEVLAIFTGADAYITPGWYSAEPDVPTWNYRAVHVRGAFKLVDDPITVRGLLTRTVDRYESMAGQGWKLEELDESLMVSLERGIAAFSIEITRLDGASKLSQDKSIVDRQQVIDGLERRAAGQDCEVSDAMRQTLPFSTDDGSACGVVPPVNGR